MAHSWSIYATVSRTAAANAVEAMYETLGGIVGEDLAEHLDPGEALEPPVLGFWPDVSVPPDAKVPTATEARASVTAPKGAKATVEDAALERLAKCVSAIQLEGPQGLDPALVTTLRALVESVGPCVFAGGPGLELCTSELLLKRLADQPDLATMLRSVAAGELDEDEEEDEDEDEDEEEEEEDDEPASDSARPEVLRSILAEIAQHPRARRKASELLAEAPKIVGTFAERLARVGAEPDPAVAKALDVKERDVLGARKALATILRRAENR